MTSPYKRLAVEVGIHFLIMYAVMYTMVDSVNNIYINANNFYMTGMMVTPMIALMLITMGHMYKNKTLNTVLYMISIVAFIILFVFEREQSFIGNEQFVKSMIPHHSGAILMCEKSKITDQELKILCEEIVKNQQREIDQLKNILTRLKNET